MRQAADPALPGILPTERGDFSVSFPDSDSCEAAENVVPCREDK